MSGNSFHEKSACEFSSHQQSISCNSTHWASSPGCQLLLLLCYGLSHCSGEASQPKDATCFLVNCCKSALSPPCRMSGCCGGWTSRDLELRVPLEWGVSWWAGFDLGCSNHEVLPLVFSPDAMFSNYFPKFRAAVSELKGGLNKGLSSSKKGSNSAHMKI